MKRIITCLFLTLLFSHYSFAQYNALETYTTGNGLGNNASTALMVEPDGTLWVGHDFYGQPSLNGKPISKRAPDGTWSYPFQTAGLSTPTVNGTPYSWTSFNVAEIHRANDGTIWFLTDAPNINDMNNAPPVLSYKNGNFSAHHISLNNFPNKGAVHTMLVDGNGDLWFGCEGGLVYYDPVADQFSSFNPPIINFANANNHTSDRVFALDYDNTGKILAITGHPFSIGGPSSCLRIYDPVANTWDFWSHQDAPWWNAGQVFYSPEDVIATRDANNRVWVSSDGGGMYWIDNSNWAGNNLNQIANFVKGWSHPGFVFMSIYTNLPEFVNDLYFDPQGNHWIKADNGRIYKHQFQQATTYNGLPATHHLYGYKHCSILFNNNGSMTASPYQTMAFHENEIWLGAQHGLEHYYYDSLNPPPAYIGLKGAQDYKGVAGFNTKSNNVYEPAATAHVVPGNWPGISIDTAYYYLATTDYENIDPAVNAGIVGNGFAQGFNRTQAALNAAGLDFDDLSLRFSAISLNQDVKGDNWDYTDSLETRTYEEWFSINGNGEVESESHYEILLGNHVMFKGRMPDFHLKIRFNRYGYLFDSIGGFTDPTPLVPHNNITDPNAADVKDSILADLAGDGVSFVFRTIQLALNEEIATADRRGGRFKIFDAYIRKEAAPAIVNDLPMCGDYQIGQTANADYPDFSSAAADLERRGMICDIRFHVGKGTYNEQFSLSEVEGNGLYSITFNGGGSTPQLEYSPNHADSNYVVQINGIDKLRFKNLGFSNEAATYGAIFDLNGRVDNFQLKDCELNGKSSAPNTPTSTADRYSLFNCAICDSLQIINSSFSDGSNALDFKGDSILIAQNIFEGNTKTAIDANNSSPVEFRGNRILGPAAGNFKGIIGSGHPLLIADNQILNNTADCRGAIEVTNFGGLNAGDTVRIENNEISVQLGLNSVALLTYCDQVKVLHNSINVLGNNNGSIGILNFGQDGAWIARNNIIRNPNGVCFFSVRNEVGGAYADSDYNLYFSNSATPFKTTTGFDPEVAQADLAAFQTATSADANSLFLDPSFATEDHLLPLNNAVNGLGTGLNELRLDRLGRQRDLANPDQGCYEFDGKGWTGANSNDWNDPMNWSDSKVPTSLSKVFISPQNNNPTIDTTVEVKEFIMHHKANLHIEANSGLQVDSLLNNSGEIILEANVAGGYARLVHNKISGGGSIRQEAVISAPDTMVRWFHLGVPVRTKVSDLANSNTHIRAGSAGASIYFWNSQNGTWESPADTAAFLDPGRGYAVAAGENAYGNFLCTDFPAKIDVSGDLIAAEAPLHIDLNYTANGSFNSYVSQITDGWNFLANPYHAVYDMRDQVLPGTYKSIYVWNGTTYKQYNTDLDVGDNEARYIAPLQGFFIRVDSAQAAQGFDFNPDQRDLTSLQNVQKKGDPKFSLQVKGGRFDQKDQCYFMIHEDASLGFEETKDAAKLHNAIDHPNLYSFALSKEVAINVLPESPLLQGVKIGFESNEDTTYSISLSPNYPEAYHYYLHDALLDRTVRLDQEVYQFEHKNHFPSDRFTLFLRKNSVDDADFHFETEDIYWNYANRSIGVYQLPSEELELTLINLTGQELGSYTKAANENEIQIPVKQLTQSVVILRIESLNRSFKVLIN